MAETAELENVELVRARVVRGISNEMVRVRAWLSMSDQPVQIIDKLRGKQGDDIVADLVERVMTHLGHVTQLKVGDNQQSKARQAVAGIMGRLRG